MSPPLSALIVDDDPSATAVFNRLLTKMGYAVQSADNGEQAVELIKSRTFDLALVNKQLSGLGGSSVARALRSNTPDAVIIFITGHATTTSAEELVGIADEYLTKPFDLDTLRETVSALVAQRRGFRQAQPSLPGQAAQLSGGAADGSDLGGRRGGGRGAQGELGITLPSKPEQAFVVLSGALR